MNNQQESFEEKFQNLNNTADMTSQFDPRDIQNNKVMAILGLLRYSGADSYLCS